MPYSPRRSRSVQPADLRTRPVIHPQPLGAAADIDAGGDPGKRPSVDPLADIAGEEQGARTGRGEGNDEAKLARAEVLSFVDDNVAERTRTFLLDNATETIADLAPCRAPAAFEIL